MIKPTRLYANPFRTRISQRVHAVEPALHCYLAFGLGGRRLQVIS